MKTTRYWPAYFLALVASLTLSGSAAIYNCAQCGLPAGPFAIQNPLMGPGTPNDMPLAAGMRAADIIRYAVPYSSFPNAPQMIPMIYWFPQYPMNATPAPSQTYWTPGMDLPGTFMPGWERPAASYDPNFYW